MKGYFAYVRVSTVKQGEHGVSLEAQREIIERFAASQNLTIKEWFTETQTAAKCGRPVFSQLMKRLRRRHAAGLIVHKLDRGARNLRDWSDLGDLIDSGIKVHFAGDNVDLNTRAGRLSADLQAVVAADFIRNLREETRKGFYGRLKQGIYPLPAPHGYVDQGRGKPKEIDSVQGPLVRQAFELYASGLYSFEKLGDEMHRRGLRSRRGGPISINGLSTMLNNTYYVGVIRIRRTGESFPGIHEPLISRRLFDKVRDVLHGKVAVRTHRHQFLYSKLWRCGICNSGLIGEVQKGHHYYRCHTKNCDTKGIREETITEAVLTELEQITLNQREQELWRQSLFEIINRLQDDKAKSKRQSELQLDRMRSRLSRLTDALLDGVINRDVFTERREALLMEQAELSQVGPDIDNLPGYVDEYLELAKTAYLLYKTGPIETKRNLVKKLTSNRRVIRKDVVVELLNPFRLMKNRASSPHSDPYRGLPRTADAVVSSVIQWCRDNPLEGLEFRIPQAQPKNDNNELAA